MTVRGVTSVIVLLAIAAGACGAGGSDAAVTTLTTARATTTSTAPERPTSTTTTMYDPAAAEGQVEAAYLRSWDVYADAVYNLHLDEAALAEVYAGEHLQTKRREIQGRIDAERAALVRVDHDYTVRMVDESTAIVIDRLVNHQVLVDPRTKKPIEADPNQRLTDAVKVQLVNGSWRVVRKDRL